MERSNHSIGQDQDKVASSQATDEQRRHSDHRNSGWSGRFHCHSHHHNLQMPMGPGSVQLSYKTAPTIYAVPPYAQSYATLPHKMSSSSQPSLRQQNFSTMGRMPVNGQQQQHQQQQHQQQPYYIYQDDKAYR
jgi:hypothetical protein